MLKIKDDVDLKELGNHNIFPRYECNRRTGEVFLTEYEYVRGTYSAIIAKQIDYNEKNIYKIELIKELDLYYDLIKADMVEKI